MSVTSIVEATSPCSCVDLRLLLEEQLTRVSAKQIINMFVIRFIFRVVFKFMMQEWRALRSEQ